MISFLLDMNLPSTLGKMLEREGFSCTHISQVADVRTSDLDIMQLAVHSNQVILTHDLDFGELLAISGANFPSVVIFRIRQVNANVFFQLIKDYFTKDILDALAEGALVIVEEQHIRVRQLPLKKR